MTTQAKPKPALRPRTRAGQSAAGPKKEPRAGQIRGGVLSGKQRIFLRGLAHELKPVVQVGVGGLTEPVVKQIDGALETHELIKLKLAKECPVDTAAVAPLLEQQLCAHVAQRIGRTVVVYRPRKKDPTIRLPR